MVGRIGLSGAAASAVSGLRDAMNRMDQAAQAVADGGAPASDTVTISSAGRSSSAADLVKPLLDMRMAKYDAAAQVSVLRTTDEVSQDVLGIVDPQRR